MICWGMRGWPQGTGVPDQRVGGASASHGGRIANWRVVMPVRRMEGASCETPSSEAVNETSIDCGHHLGHVGPRRW